MKNKNGFIPTEIIKDPTRLFGRKKPERELDKLLLSIVESGCNPQIIAERRSGKTSLLNCLIDKICQNKRFGNIIPVLINFKDHYDIIGVNNGYYLLSSYLLEKCNRLDVWTRENTLEFRDKKIKMLANKFEYYDFLVISNWSSEKFFTDIVYHLSKLGFSTLLFIDEYESMYFSTFQGRLGSVHTIRDMTMSELENNQKFRCAISGARPWDYYAQDIGSDDFNFIDDYLFLHPLSDEESIDIFIEGVINSKGRMFYNLKSWESSRDVILSFAGGWPYLVKIIGNDLAQLGSISKDNLKNRLFSHFNNIWNRLPPEYQYALKGQSESNTIKKDLINWGLGIIKKKFFSDILIPRGKLWQDFVNEIPIKNKQKDHKLSVPIGTKPYFNLPDLDIHTFEIQQLGSEATDKITEINEVLIAKNLRIIFDTTLSLNYPQHFKNIGIVSKNEDQFKNFIASLYIIVFESTQKKQLRKNGKWKILNMANYPACFNRYPKSNEPDIFHHIDGLRHKFLKAHDTLSSNFKSRRFSPEDSQAHFLGHRNRPKNDEFTLLQRGLLKEFSFFLSELLEWANNQNYYN